MVGNRQHLSPPFATHVLSVVGVAFLHLITIGCVTPPLLQPCSLSPEPTNTRGWTRERTPPKEVQYTPFVKVYARVHIIHTVAQLRLLEL